jgi:hypothetical protein
MKHIIKSSFCLAICLTTQTIADDAEPTTPAPATYEATTESLRTAAIPEWFIDGKLGIFMHWGPESLAGYKSCWYARQIYEEGSDAYKCNGFFTPVNGVDTRMIKPTAFEATSIRRSNGRPLGNYRWLVWALSPLEDGIGGGNSSFQELQVIPATQRK